MLIYSIGSYYMYKRTTADIEGEVACVKLVVKVKYYEVAKTRAQQTQRVA